MKNKMKEKMIIDRMEDLKEMIKIENEKIKVKFKNHKRKKK